MPIGFAALAGAIAASWGPDTCDPQDLPWSARNPPRGQCGVSALVLQDFCGGELLLSEVLVDGARVGYHWWNRLPDGSEVDLTRGQFRADEVVGAPRVVPHPPGPPGRCASSTTRCAGECWSGLRSRPE